VPVAFGSDQRSSAMLESPRFRNSENVEGQPVVSRGCETGELEEESGLWNQIFKLLHAETADIDLALAVDDLLRQRLPNGGGVLKSMA
jgi:hypothetical protein